MRSEEVGVDQIVRVAITPRQRWRFRRTLDDPLKVWKFQIRWVTDISVDKLDSCRAETWQVEFGASPLQIVEGDDFLIREFLFEPDRKTRTDKTRTSCDEDHLWVSEEEGWIKERGLILKKAIDYGKYKVFSFSDYLCSFAQVLSCW